MQATDKRQTIEQQRAQHAWQAIERIASKNDDDADDYAREAKKMPVRIMTAGLGQALAFIRAKAKGEEESNKQTQGKKKGKPGLKQLEKDLTDWVIRGRNLRAKNPDSLLESIIEGDVDFLRRATEETLAYLIWLNRFAEAKGLPKKANE